MSNDPNSPIYREVVRGLVARMIFCPLSGKALDFRTCGVLLDPDGVPVEVFHQTALDRAERAATRLDGYTVASR